MPKPPWVPGIRRFANDIDQAHAEDADAEEARAEADYQRWLAKSWFQEGYDEPDDAFDPRDRDDRLEREGGRLI